MKGIALLLLLASSPCRAQDWADATRPVYRGMETIMDGVYGLVRGHLFSAMLPGRLSRRMSAVPAATSDALFAARLRERQRTAARKILESRPACDPAALEGWKTAALRAHVTAATDAFADTLVRRYQLERFGRDSSDYAGNVHNWDPEFAASAALLGGAYLYAAGLRADWTMGPVRLDVDTAAGANWAGAARSGEGRGLAALSLSRRASPLSIKSDWGLRGGHLAAQRVGVNYTARFY